MLFTRKLSKADVNPQFQRVLTLFRVAGGLRNRPSCQMSGGEQQLRSIASSLIDLPRLLLRNQPSVGTAPVLVQALHASLLRWRHENLCCRGLKHNMFTSQAVRVLVLLSGHLKVVP